MSWTKHIILERSELTIVYIPTLSLLFNSVRCSLQAVYLFPYSRNILEAGYFSVPVTYIYLRPVNYINNQGHVKCTSQAIATVIGIRMATSLFRYRRLITMVPDRAYQ